MKTKTKSLVILVVLLFSICLSFTRSISQSNNLKKLIELKYKLAELDTLNPLITNQNQKEVISKFWSFHKKLIDKELERALPKGKINFGFIGNQSSRNTFFTADRSTYIVNGGLELVRGNFPSEFKISTLINVNIDNGKFRENLSDLRISYDRHLESQKNPLLTENYVFISRRSDQFLGVSQRYEVGGGIILAHWKWKKQSSRDGEQRYVLVTDEATKEITELDSIYRNYKAYKDKTLKICMDKCVPPIRVEGIEDSDLDVLRLSQQNSYYAIAKRYSPLRAGILIGLFIEIEQTSFSDSVDIDVTSSVENIFVNRTFDATTRLRWELRPTLEFKLIEDAVSFSFRPYLKFPFWWNWTQKVEDKEVFDFRLDFPATMSIKLNDNTAIDLNHTIYYDNTPSSISYYGSETAPFITNRKLHHVTTFQVSFKIGN